MKATKHNAFSMIELLVVIAILSVLSLIAINIIQSAKIRAQVAKVQSDFSHLRTAINSFQLDSGNTPDGSYTILGPISRAVENMHELTTPTAYISQLPKSPWQGKNNHLLNMMNHHQRERIFVRLGVELEEDWTDYPDYSYTYRNTLEPNTDNWLLYSNGPTRISSFKPYNPSNGVISIGAVMLSQSGATERRY